MRLPAGGTVLCSFPAFEAVDGGVRRGPAAAGVLPDGISDGSDGLGAEDIRHRGPRHLFAQSAFLRRGRHSRLEAVGAVSAGRCRADAPLVQRFPDRRPMLTNNCVSLVGLSAAGWGESPLRISASASRNLKNAFGTCILRRICAGLFEFDSIGLRKIPLQERGITSYTTFHVFVAGIVWDRVISHSFQ